MTTASRLAKWSRVDHEELRLLGTLTDQVAVLLLECTFKTAEIARLGNVGINQGDLFNKVISDVHH